MAIFNLTDISFGNSSSTGGTNTLVGGKYESNLHRYPIDIGETNRGHYMVIHINVQDASQYKNSFEYMKEGATVNQNAKNLGIPSIRSAAGTITSNPVTQQVSSTVVGGLSSLLGGVNDVIGSFSPELSGFLDGVGKSLLSTGSDMLKAYGDVSQTRRINRTTDTIALYMPDTLVFQNNQRYSDVSIGQNLVTAGIAGAASASKTLSSGASPELIGKQIAKNLSPYLLSYALNEAGGLGQSMFSVATGMVENPMLELLYTSPEFRSFRFDFMFYPRSQQEANSVLSIINRLQFHQSPELKREFYGYYLVPPSEFDIKFYYNGQLNTNIPSISTCVLESIDVDYAPNGFTAYEVPGQTTPSKGGTGMPVAIRLSLQFKETEIMTKAHYADGRQMDAETQMSLADVNPYAGSDYHINTNGRGTDTTSKTYTDRFDLNGFRDDTKGGTPPSRTWERFIQNKIF